MYRISHNHSRGYRNTFEEAWAAMRARLGEGEHYVLASWSGVNAKGDVRNVFAYYSPATDKYDVFAIEGYDEDTRPEANVITIRPG